MNWNRTEYRRIQSVQVEGDDLVVSFADGSRVRVDANRLLPPGTRDAAWSQLDFTPFEITVPAEERVVEIPWSRIRALTDRKYSAHLAQMAEREAKLIGSRIKELRAVRGITSKDLAERAGITPQSLSRIENGRHGISFPTLQRMLAAMGASLADLSRKPVDATGEVQTLAALLKRLTNAGVDKQLLLRRIFSSRDLVSATQEEQSLVQKYAALLSHVFGWTPGEIVGSESLRLKPAVLASAYFRMPRGRRRLSAIAYTNYAHFIAHLVLKASPSIRVKDYPVSAPEVRRVLGVDGSHVTFESLLAYVWDLGIRVLPLGDPGGFYAACWRINGNDVIVLKQGTLARARWLFDLLHELAHVLKHLGKKTEGIVDFEEVSPFLEGKQEHEANEFAGEVIFGGRQEILAELCVKRARHRLEYLKQAVIEVAQEQGVPLDSLANYLAFRLAMQGENWWGTANTLQDYEPAPHHTVREQLRSRLDMAGLDDSEQGLLEKALAEATNGY